MYRATGIHGLPEGIRIFAVAGGKRVDSTSVEDYIELLLLLSSLNTDAGSHPVGQSCLELAILLPLPPMCWVYRPEPPHPAHHINIKQQ